ncbi:hypothetical protein [Streptomyces sp. NPDC088789]|uniref:hypothetical protein n=1 Tax=Streptomyces sp. NPDC088789 TaxID=3365899 RepID=UPI003811822A
MTDELVRSTVRVTGEAMMAEVRQEAMAACLRERGYGGIITDTDRMWMRQALDLARLCPLSTKTFFVGAVVVDVNGRRIARYGTFTRIG